MLKFMTPAPRQRRPRTIVIATIVYGIVATVLFIMANDSPSAFIGSSLLALAFVVFLTIALVKRYIDN